VPLPPPLALVVPCDAYVVPPPPAGVPGPVCARVLYSAPSPPDLWLQCPPPCLFPVVPPLQESLGLFALVFDAVYTPLKTRLLRDAEAAGAGTVSGLEMFVGQAARQFELFTGKPGMMLVYPPYSTVGFPHGALAPEAVLHSASACGPGHDPVWGFRSEARYAANIPPAPCTLVKGTPVLCAWSVTHGFVPHTTMLYVYGDCTVTIQ